MNLKNIALKTVGHYLNLHAHIRPKQAAAMGLNLFCRPFAKKTKTAPKAISKKRPNILNLNMDKLKYKPIDGEMALNPSSSCMDGLVIVIDGEPISML
jgi:hypothetical protein